MNTNANEPRGSMEDDLAARFQREQLHRAARDGDLAAVNKWIKAGYPLNRFDDLGKTPLHYAVEGEHLDVVDTLIRAGANVNAHDERVIGNTPLSDHAATCSYEMAARLLAAGADPTIRGWMSLTAIDRARERNDDGRVLRLLQSASKPRR